MERDRHRERESETDRQTDRHRQTARLIEGAEEEEGLATYVYTCCVELFHAPVMKRKLFSHPFSPPKPQERTPDRTQFST